MHRVRSAFALVLKKESEAPPQPTRELSATGGESWLVYVDLQSFAFHQNAPAADGRINGRLGDAENEMAQRGVVVQRRGRIVIHEDYIGGGAFFQCAQGEAPQLGGEFGSSARFSFSSF